MIPDDVALEYFHRALKEEIGVALRTDNKRGLKAKLYAVREAAGDPALDEIIIFDPDGDEIWLCKKSTEMP